MSEQDAKPITCRCGGIWKIQDNLSGYVGEVVLVCLSCGDRYYNAQEFFPDSFFDGLDHIKEKGAKP